ncbi:hypothetical protein SAE02_66020 [Skermanella aerolata]|jgi:hypothetical protein|uniref:Flagellar protein FlgN n=1 Tax=Skermanella aerolata TaxID=393310 RepID=A0A512E146_9PROT|nr:flagellar protein FlgN [Skermanella aerolata]KJB90181.1 hypothetical protein N826_40920 [Skermanella aerolata KACC 11604]GEO42454.1 hypothetical protein SAE02_66020 [Skermanella aerolata]
MDATTAVIETCQTMEAFTALMERETEAAGAMRLEDVTRIGDAKTALGKKLDHQILVLRHNKAVIAQLPAELRQRLGSLWERLDAAAEANLSALKRAEAATRRVIDIVVDVTKQKQQQGAISGYGRPSARYPTGRAPQPMSVAVNTTL